MTIVPLENRVELVQKRQEQLENIREGISKVKKEVSDAKGKVAIVGASILVGYLLYRLVFRGSKNVVLVPETGIKHNSPVQMVESVVESPIVASIRGYIVSFLLSLAKQKIQVFLDEMYKNDDGRDLQRTDREKA